MDKVGARSYQRGRARRSRLRLYSCAAVYRRTSTCHIAHACVLLGVQIATAMRRARREQTQDRRAAAIGMTHAMRWRMTLTHVARLRAFTSTTCTQKAVRDCRVAGRPRVPWSTRVRDSSFAAWRGHDSQMW